MIPHFGSTRLLVSPLVVALVVAGCSTSSGAKTDTTTTSVRQGAATTHKTGEEPDPKEVMELAKSYTFGDERGDVPTTMSLVTGNNHGVAKNNKPKTITIATASRPGDPLNHEILARITAERAYPGLGIGNDENYIWRNRNNSTRAKDWDVWLVSTKPLGKTLLTRQNDPFSSGTPSEPRLVSNAYSTPGPGGTREDMIAYGVCIDDPTLCGTGHCGYNYQ